MAGLCLLYAQLFKVCVNGMIPKYKLEVALSNMHRAEAIYFHKEHVDSWSSHAGSQVRMVAQMWRDCAADAETLQTCLKKAYHTLSLKIDRAIFFRIMSLGGCGESLGNVTFLFLKQNRSLGSVVFILWAKAVFGQCRMFLDS